MSQLPSLLQCELYAAKVQGLRLTIEGLGDAGVATIPKVLASQIKTMQQMLQEVDTAVKGWRGKEECLKKRMEGLHSLDGKLVKRCEAQDLEATRLQKWDQDLKQQEQALGEQINEDRNTKVSSNFHY